LTYEIGNRCVLDFAGRAVTVVGELQLLNARVTIVADDFTVSADGLIQGNDNTGSQLKIEASGDVEVLSQGRASGEIDVSGSTAGGLIDIASGGSVRIDGTLRSDADGVEALGGEIDISALGDIITGESSEISALGSRDGGDGGTIQFVSGGRVDLGAALDVGAAFAGSITIQANGPAVIRDIAARSVADAGDGGVVEVTATEVELAGFVDVRGDGPEVNFGGSGGSISVDAFYGNVTVTGRIDASGAPPDGNGGDITVSARGNVLVAADGGRLLADGEGIDGGGGDVSVEAGLDLTMSGDISGEGGFEGGLLSLAAGRSMSVDGTVSAQGRSVGSFGGEIDIESSFDGTGSFSLAGTLDVTGGGCSLDLGCGAGGTADVSACDLVVTSTGLVDARGGDGGFNELVARRQLTVDGTVTAIGRGVDGIDGVNTLVFAEGSSPAVRGTVPPPVLNPQPLCSGPGQNNCLIPCPVCGNNVVEFPEGCDDTGPPAGCDGCSVLCILENCDDGNPCSEDLCDPNLGCNSVPDPVACTPTPTRTRTPSPTPTRPPGSPVPTPTRTRTATATATPTTGTGDPGDANCDGVIDAADLQALTERLFSPGCEGADVNQDGAVTAADLPSLVTLLDF
jgi:hypothetical protein